MGRLFTVECRCTPKDSTCSSGKESPMARSFDNLSALIFAASFHLNSRCHSTVMSSTCSAAEDFPWIRDILVSLATKRRPTKRVTFRWTLTVALGLQMVLIPGSMEHASLHIKGHQIYQKHKAGIIFLTDGIRNFSLEFFRPIKLKYSNDVLQ